MRFINYFLQALVAFGVIATINAAEVRLLNVSYDVTREFYQEYNLQFADVREDEWREGHAHGALHLSRGIIEFEIQEHAPDLNTPLILCCGRGRRSALVADNLQKMGDNKVVVVAGGLEACEASGLPVERPD